MPTSWSSNFATASTPQVLIKQGKHWVKSQVQTSIEHLERSVQRRRQESQEAQTRLEEFRDVLEVVKNTLGNGAGALARKHAENANLTAQIEEKRVSLDTARRKYQVSHLRWAGIEMKHLPQKMMLPLSLQEHHQCALFGQ